MVLPPTGSGGSQVIVTARCADGHTVLRLAGTLDTLSYRSVRDQIVKAALAQPHSVIIDIDQLVVHRDSAWSVFTAARWLVHEWPGVPLMLLCSEQSRRQWLARKGIGRYMAVHDLLDAAVRSAFPQQSRLCARLALPADSEGTALARGFVSMWLTRWGQPELISAAKIVVTELVQNVLHHTASLPRIRLETDGGTVVVAVQDDDPTPAKMPETGPGTPAMGLRIIDAVSAGWRTAPLADGKVVWAALDATTQI